MATTGTSQIIAGVSTLLAIATLCNVFCPYAWQTSESAAIRVEASLHTVKTSPGAGLRTASWFIGKIGFSAIEDALGKVLNTNMWLWEAVPSFCSPIVEFSLGWCDEWQVMKWASLCMMLAGCLAAFFQLVGGALSYYYTHTHATQTGRHWANICMILAPVLNFAGATQYTIATMSFGDFGGSAVFVNGKTIAGPGIIFMWTIVVLSWVPIFVQTIFSKVAKNEKRHDDSSDEETAGKGYGSTSTAQSSAAAPVPMAAAGAPYPVVVGAPQLVSIQAQLPSNIPPPPSSTPGYGQPAW